MKIIAVSLADKYNIILQKLQELVKDYKLDPVSYAMYKSRSAQCVSIMRKRLIEAIYELSRLTNVSYYMDDEKTIIDVPFNIDISELPYFIGIETTNTLNQCTFIKEGNILIMNEYNATLLLNAFSNCLQYHSLYSRDIIFDDEAYQRHLFFTTENEYIVLKIGDGGTWMKVYDNFNDAITDYMTVDYGWKSKWYPLQAQEVKVKPKFSREFPNASYDIILKFIKHYGIEKLKDAIVVNITNLHKYIREYLEAKCTIGEWICNDMIAIAPKTATPFSSILNSIPKEYIKERETLENSLAELEQKLHDTKLKLATLKSKPKVTTFRGNDNKVIARLEGKIVLFEKQPPINTSVVLISYDTITTRKGTKCVICFSWELESEINKLILLLEKEKETLEQKVQKTKDDIKQLIIKYCGDLPGYMKF